MSKISVIIPIYNCEKFLRKCLESIINQTLEDIEIICVNDCSCDDSYKILQEYSLNDSRFRVVNFTENKGVSTARNTGFELATGDYIATIDSDDFLDLDFYESLYNKALETGAEVVIGNVIELRDKKINFANNINKIRSNKSYFYGFLWLAIYKKQLLDTIGFLSIPNLCYAEDRLVPVIVAHKVKKIEIVDSTFYYYNKHVNSLTTSGLTFTKIRDLGISYSMILSYLNQNNFSIEEYGIIFNELLDNTLLHFLITDDQLYSEILKILKMLYDNLKHKNLIQFNQSELLNYLFSNTSIQLSDVKKIIFSRKMEKLKKTINK